jgi:hypothetical protein
VCLWRIFLTWHELVELGTYTSAIIFVTNKGGSGQSNGWVAPRYFITEMIPIWLASWWRHLRSIYYFSSCFYIHNSIGAASLCLAWFSLVLSMRKFPKLGIYVVMFTEMFRTFAQFFVVLLLFIIAFGLGFHVLLYDQVRRYSRRYY